MLKHFRSAVPLLLAAGLSFSVTAAHADEHRKMTSERGTVAQPQQRWEPDAALRQGMENIRNAMLANEMAIREDRLASAEYRRLADLAAKNVDAIVKESKLPKEANSALHVIVLSDMNRSIELMRSDQKTAVQRAGAFGVLQSLRLYGDYFRHPGWEMGSAKVQ